MKKNDPLKVEYDWDDCSDVVKEVEECAYRYEEVRYSWGVDEWENALPGHDLKVYLRSYKIIKRTRKGIWIKLFKYSPLEDKKFVNLTSRKKFACLTKEEAIDSFIARKKRQTLILNGQLKDANEALEMAERLKIKLLADESKKSEG